MPLQAETKMGVSVTSDQPHTQRTVQEAMLQKALSPYRT